LVGEDHGERNEGRDWQPPKKPPLIIRVFRHLKRRNNRRRAQQKKETDQQRNERLIANWTRRVGIWTIVVAIAAILSDVIFFNQLRAMWDANQDTRKVANAAKESADTARDALIGVERPVLLIDGLYIDPLNTKERPKFDISVENAGKQMARLIAATGTFTVTSRPKLANVSLPAQFNDTICPFHFLGEIPLRVGAHLALSCNRISPLTPKEVSDLRTRHSIGLLYVVIEYADPVGTQRVSATTFAYFAPKDGADCAAFIPVISKDRIGDNRKGEGAQNKYEDAELPLALATRGRDIMPSTFQVIDVRPGPKCPSGIVSTLVPAQGGAQPAP